MLQPKEHNLRNLNFKRKILQSGKILQKQGLWSERRSKDLEENIKFCKNCVMPSSRPGMRMNENGVCMACLWHEKKSTIDWEFRSQQLHRIAAWARSTSRSSWHCVLGVSGGKDSLWQAHQLRDHYGLNPLLVMYVSSDVTELGRMNAENMVRCGFTVHSIQPNPRIAVKLARKSFFEHGNIAKFSELALFTAPFRTAIEHNIPLVFFGENAALENGDTNTENPGWDASGIRYSNTLAGAAHEIWLDEANGIRREDLIPYTFPHASELQEWGGRGVFMGYFLNWSGWNNAVFSIGHGMTPHSLDYEDLGMHYKHHSLDSNNGAAVNFLMKYIKFGFGEATEHASYDVRANRITRKEAIALVKRLDGKCNPKLIKDFCSWIDITEESFWEIANSYRGTMWRQDTRGEWHLKKPIWYGMNDIDTIETQSVIERIDTIHRGQSLTPQESQTRRRHAIL
ncbi:MAG: N-acetyl sugar amidotransferase [Alphaproteobacteria bacterium]|nr:N-acetyl sugar amidotransferase [Alphaproteobacteria bacterium]